MSIAELIHCIDAVLPQTQCRRCGYAGCRPYAEAMARGEAQINQCPPGGDEVIRELAAITQRAVLPLDPRFGYASETTVAFIDEARCIGCTLCIQACPVDAIVGAAKLMHTVIAQECTGCELCIDPCPVDCIAMQPLPQARRDRAETAAHWRNRYEFHCRRLEREAAEKSARLASRREASTAQAETRIAAPKREAIAAAVAAALDRARQRRLHSMPSTSADKPK